MKMQNFNNDKKENVILVMILFSLAIMLMVIFNEINRVEKPMIEPKPKQVSVYEEWKDNFDSTFIFNGCIHYTNKQI